MHLSVKLIFREQSQMTTKAGQAPPIGSSHLGISGGTCHSSGSAPCSEGLHGALSPSWGLGWGWDGERRKGELILFGCNKSAAWLFPRGSGERRGTGITFCSGLFFFPTY